MARDKETTDWYRNRGICIVCQKRKARPNGSLCEVCRERIREYGRTHAEKHKADGRALYRWYKDQGVCVRCRRIKTESGRAYCPDCMKDMLNNCKRRIETWRKEGRCIRCGGERDVEGRLTCSKCLGIRKRLKS